MMYFNESVGDIVTKLPKAADVFRKYKIDFCCGGHRKLAEVIKEQGLKEEVIGEELSAVYEASKKLKNEKQDWKEAPYDQLVDYIVETHHGYLQRELPKLSALTTKILRVHGIDHGEVLSQVHKFFHSLKAELEQHLIKEEELVFPLIREYQKNPSQELLKRIDRANKELEEEHEGAGGLLKKLRKITNDYHVPSGGCHSFELTYRGLEELEGDTFQHVHLENNILFPRLKAEIK